MGKIHIITDSSVQFLDPILPKQLDITVVPVGVRFGNELLREGEDLDAEGYFRRILTEGMPVPALESPSVAAYSEVISQLTHEADHIIILPMAHGLSDSFHNAQLAAEALRGRCEIVVIDSLTTSVGLAFLVETAARAARTTTSLENVVRVVRGAIPRIYSVFYVETLDYLFRGHLIGEAQSILGKVLGIKPFLTIEDGVLVAMEKVRTRNQAVDKLVEFVTEFADVQQLVIVQNTSHTTEQTRMIQDRLALEFGGRDFPVMMYGPTVGTHLGPDGVGIIVYEAEEED
ncbi:DegV family protein [Chloroflexota bacterium]